MGWRQRYVNWRRTFGMIKVLESSPCLNDIWHGNSFPCRTAALLCGMGCGIAESWCHPNSLRQISPFYQTNNILPTTPIIFLLHCLNRWSCFSPSSTLSHPHRSMSTVWERDTHHDHQVIPLMSARCPCCAWFMSLWQTRAVAASSRLAGFPRAPSQSFVCEPLPLHLHLISF